MKRIPPDIQNRPAGGQSKAAAAASGALSILDKKLQGKVTVDRPFRKSFEDFLNSDARVPIGGGEYGKYSFEGREAILEIVRIIDHVLANKVEDAQLAIAGGAQWGKTILELNFAAYATSHPFFNFGLFLPDNDLVAGVIDTKFRPDVIDQIPWFSEMVKVGKAVNKSGKAVDRKGAFVVTDGHRRANGLAIGLQKIPTTFTLDIAAMDEVDDIPEKNAKFVRGRLTSSKLRFILRIGTQRVHGRGQEQAWKNGSQGVLEFLGVNPEEAFPGIVRCAVSKVPRRDDPKLTWAGDFRREGSEEVVAVHHPDNLYYLAHPKTGEVMDRNRPELRHRRPERIEEDNYSVRVSQLSIGAIGLRQIIGQFQLAVKDPDEMVVFRCDVLALPQSTAQALTPEVIARSQSVDPFEMRMAPIEERTVFGGLDTGDRCYFFARERQTAARKRMIYAATIPAGDLVRRVPGLFDQMGMQCLFIDQRPLVSQARTIALMVNGLSDLKDWPQDPEEKDFISLPGGLAWTGSRWTGLRCAVVRFDKKNIGAGVEHGFDLFEEDGIKKFVPLIRCNRYETIDRAVREFLTPAESIVDVADGKVRELPAMLLPRKNSGKILEEVESHLITGSERGKEKDGNLGDYVDQCANHFLLADGYSALAENEGSRPSVVSGFFMPKSLPRGGGRQVDRRDRSCVA